ncbi:uncharacterized protein LOC135806570 [Sycon ciliatum]|uniref:uncharacterized protein LOC135806570 n=1 Tax=Sycon ciliatum TaxID=27933 RepID=UPI0020AB7CAE|eukprot:scpid46687/ scgid31826/ 
MGNQTSSVAVDRLPDLWVEGGFTDSPKAPRSTSFSGAVANNVRETSLASRPSSTTSGISSSTASTGVSSMNSYDADDDEDYSSDTLSAAGAGSKPPSGIVSINSESQTATFRHFSSPADMQNSREELRRRRSNRKSQLSLSDDGDGKMELKRRVSFQQRMRYDLVLDRTAGLNSMDKEGRPGKLTLITTSHFDQPDQQDDKSRLLDCPTEIYLEDVTERVEKYNKDVGRERIWVTADGTQLEGYIEVKLNLQHAIHVIRTPTASHNLLDGVDHKRASLQLVRLDAGTKTLLVSSDTTTGELIEQLVTVYRVVEDPEMFALFECDSAFPANSRRLDGEERPLLLSLIWGPNNSRSLVLQEAHPGGAALSRSHDWREVGAAALAASPASNPPSVPTTPEAETPTPSFGSATSSSSASSASSASSSSSPASKENRRSRRISRTGKTINWLAFSIPELNNFLSILEFEEERQIKKIESQYGKYKGTLIELLMHKQPSVPTEPFQTEI